MGMTDTTVFPASFYARLSDYELAALFHDVATWRPTNQEEADHKLLELDELNAVMDRRDIRLEDWDVSYR